MPFSCQITLLPWRSPFIRGFGSLRSSILNGQEALVWDKTHNIHHHSLGAMPYSWVLILSNGVTARSDSVKPAPNPAITVFDPEIFPSSSARSDLNVSNATKPVDQLAPNCPYRFRYRFRLTYECQPSMSFLQSESCIQHTIAYQMAATATSRYLAVDDWVDSWFLQLLVHSTRSVSNAEIKFSYQEQQHTLCRICDR